MIKDLENPSKELLRDLEAIQGCLIAYIHNNVPALSEDMFPDGNLPAYLNLNTKQMCTRRIQMNRKCGNGVYTGWHNQPKDGVWIMHWFLWTFSVRRVSEDV